jgi:hypothetical protein
MILNSSFLEQNRDIEPIIWSNILSWARRTVHADLKTYHSKKRTLSPSRLTSLLLPNLKRPLFLIGAPRSGTTFLGQCLACLPEISYHYEPIATKAAARYVYEQHWNINKAEWFYKNVYAWLMRIQLDGDLRFAEKTPRNCFLIPFLSKIFADAQFIHIVRDGRDVALSLSKKPWYLAANANSGRFEPGGYPYGPYAQFWVEPDRREEFEATSDIHRCIWVWKRFTETALETTRSLCQSKFLELKYESLTFKPTQEADRLLDFLEIEEINSRKLFHQEVGKVNSKLVGQWKREMSDEQLSQIYKEAGNLLEVLGYAERFKKVRLI